jgi:hypothetical protein
MLSSHKSTKVVPKAPETHTTPSRQAAGLRLGFQPRPVKADGWAYSSGGGLRTSELYELDRSELGWMGNQAIWNRMERGIPYSAPVAD